MLKNIFKLSGAQQLSKKQQQTINGGIRCRDDGDCPNPTSFCRSGYCD